jgi:hypothetical protein
MKFFCAKYTLTGPVVQRIGFFQKETRKEPQLFAPPDGMVPVRKERGLAVTSGSSGKIADSL